MTTARLKTKVEALRTREEMEACVRRICELTIAQDTLTVAMDDEITQIRARYTPELAQAGAELEREMELARTWSQENPSEFAGRKSIAFVHGTAGFRTGTPRLKTLARMTWDKVLEVLMSKGGIYVRTKLEVDKESILAHREQLGTEDLSLLGVKVVQDEAFYVEPDREPLSQDKIKVAS